jgi:hypothetical protein
MEIQIFKNRIILPSEQGRKIKVQNVAQQSKICCGIFRPRFRYFVSRKSSRPFWCNLGVTTLVVTADGGPDCGDPTGPKTKLSTPTILNKKHDM